MLSQVKDCFLFHLEGAWPWLFSIFYILEIEAAEKLKLQARAYGPID